MLLQVWHADLLLTESLFISVKFFYTCKYKIIKFELTDFISNILSILSQDIDKIIKSKNKY